MKYPFFAIFSVLVLCGCHDKNSDDNVVSQRYVHKYGYAVSQGEWETKKCPGQVITYLNTGVTVTATFEGGIKHGPTTHTFPHSQTVEYYCLYNQGNKVKEISYDPAGLPIEEWIQISPTRYAITTWYQEGSPKSVEEFVGEELLEGQYFTTTNALESRIEKGSGIRIHRDRKGTLLSKETIEEGYAIKKETFYLNSAPESIAHYYRGTLNGEKRTFAQTGEPLAIEEWVNGAPHGKCVYFKNGNRYLEITYQHGEKHGVERHYIDGDIVSHEIAWIHNQKHGEAVFYADGKPESQWYYEGQRVSKRKYDELHRVDEIISHLPYAEENSGGR